MKLVYLLVLFMLYPPAYHAYNDCDPENSCNIVCGAASTVGYSYKCENSVCCCCGVGNYDCYPARGWQSCTLNPKFPDKPAPAPPPLPDCVSSDCMDFCYSYGAWASCNPTGEFCPDLFPRPKYNFCYCWNDSPNNKCWESMANIAYHDRLTN